MNRKAYKVVRTYDGVTFSSTMAQCGFALSYQIGYRTKPKYGRIFVFDTLQNAQGFFLPSSDCFRIFEGTAENVGRPRSIVADYEN